MLSKSRAYLLFYKVQFLFFCLTQHVLIAQTIVTKDSSHIIVLHDVAVTDKIPRLKLTSGRLLRYSPVLLPPGYGYAVRFAAPRAGYHRLSSLSFLRANLGQIKEGQLRIRAASVAADGGPADDNLLPGTIIIKTIELQRIVRSFRIQWPASQVVVPDGGFFLVIESQFSDSTSYIAGVAPSSNPHKHPNYIISQHGQSTAAVRLASVVNFLALQRAEASTAEVETWEKVISRTQWQRARPNTLIYVEALFD